MPLWTGGDSPFISSLEALVNESRMYVEYMLQKNVIDIQVMHYQTKTKVGNREI